MKRVWSLRPIPELGTAPKQESESPKNDSRWKEGKLRAEISKCQPTPTLRGLMRPSLIILLMLLM